VPGARPAVLTSFGFATDIRRSKHPLLLTAKYTIKMLQLPVELRRLCLESLEHERADLKNLRLINKELGVLASEILFRKVILNNTEESAEKFGGLLRSLLNPLVHNVEINTSESPKIGGGGDSEGEADISESFLEVMRLIHEFLRLEEVELKFAEGVAAADTGGWDRDVAETISFRTRIFEDLLPALRKADNVGNLTIKNLQDYHDEGIFKCEDFIAVRDQLTRLHLQIATEYDEASPEESIRKPALHTGFGQDLPNIWLKSTSNQLTHLTLYGTECYWGIYPFVDFRDIPTFSRLKSLCLGNFTIAHNWQINWIVSHSATLEELIMDDCCIVPILRMKTTMAKTNFPDLAPSKLNHGRFRITVYWKEIFLRWHMVLDRFRTELQKLSHFVMGHGNWEDHRAFEERYELLSGIPKGRYAFFDWGIGPSQWIVGGSTYNETGYTFNHGRQERQYIEFPKCHEEDHKALMSLLVCVEGRKDIHR
jgi:hypothetical protein